jgi:hypothetical protein
MERYGEKELGKVHLTSHLLTVGIPESCTALLYDVKAVINNPSNQPLWYDFALSQVGV